MAQNISNSLLKYVVAPTPDKNLFTRRCSEIQIYSIQKKSVVHKSELEVLQFIEQ